MHHSAKFHSTSLSLLFRLITFLYEFVHEMMQVGELNIISVESMRENHQNQI